MTGKRTCRELLCMLKTHTHTHPPACFTGSISASTQTGKSGAKTPGAFREPIVPAPPGGEKEVEHNTIRFQHVLFQGECCQT